MNTHIPSICTRRRQRLLQGGVLALTVVLCTQLSVRALHLRSQATSESVVVSVTVIGADDTTAVDIVAIPEKRMPPFGNDSTLLTIEVRNPGETAPLYTTQVTTNQYGGFSGALLAGIPPGTYDLTAKGYSHLRLKKALAEVYPGARIDFTAHRTRMLLSGDVNAVNGDNFVNGIDLSLIVSALLGDIVRYDLNRDGIVNGIDLSNAVANILVAGDA